MRRFNPVIAALALLASACAPQGHPAVAPVAAEVESPPPGASGKLGADQVGQASPVPAFQAVGPGWQMGAEGREGTRMSAWLHWGTPPRDDTVTLIFQSNAAGASRDRHAFAGTLYAPGGDRPVAVVLARGDCSGADGLHGWRIEVSIDGEATLHGCADVAT
jgi:hypothetical protein